MALKNALDALARANPKWFEAWRLKFFEGLAHKEIAEIIGCSLESSRRYVFEGRRFLRECLGGKEKAYSDFVLK